VPYDVLGDDSMATQVSYTRGTRSVEEIQREINSFWDQLRHDVRLREEIKDVGIDIPDDAAEDWHDAIHVEVKGAGIDPSTVALIVAFAPSANAIVVSLWKKIILPRIRRKYGRDAVGQERLPQS